jgi:NAD(P)H-dependent flavin oxidoreductase YrpB (nitropropane dioxygenase family)
LLITWLTGRLGIRYPVISASMTGVAYGELARAVSRAGGLGMLGPQAALAAVAAGVDLIEAQGTEAGGHTGTVATLPRG